MAKDSGSLWNIGNIEHEQFSWPTGHAHDAAWQSPSIPDQRSQATFEPISDRLVGQPTQWSSPRDAEASEPTQWAAIERQAVEHGQMAWSSPNSVQGGQPAQWSSPEQVAWPSNQIGKDDGDMVVDRPGVPMWQTSQLGEFLNIIGYSSMNAVPKDEFLPHQRADPVATYNPFG